MKILLCGTIIGIIMIITGLAMQHKQHPTYTPWPNAINTLEVEKTLDCDGKIFWVAQSDAYGNDTSFPVCTQITEEE